MLNKVILMGRLTRDPEIKFTQSNIPVCSFTVAVDRNYAKNGEQRQADFINVVAWRQSAEFVGKYFNKGKMIIVVGSLQTRTWDSPDGKKNYITEVVADEVSFGETKKAQEGNSYGAANGGYYESQGAAPNTHYQAPPQNQNPQFPTTAYSAPAPSDMGMPQSPFPADDFVPIDSDDDLPF